MQYMVTAAMYICSVYLLCILALYTCSVYLLLYTSGAVKGLEGEGMCNYKHHNLSGNLYFVFDVEFPPQSFINEQDMKVSL